MARKYPRQAPAPEMPPDERRQLTEDGRPLYRAYNNLVDVFKCEAREVLVEGPAGCGKTRALLEKANFLAESHAGFRGLFLRKERTSLTTSVLPIFEQHVAQPYLLGGATAINRLQYNYPNGSIIDCSGLEDPVKTYSSERDWIGVFEATELSLDDYLPLLRGLRGKAHGMGYQQIMCDCNPAHEQHWLNQRPNKSRMVRIKTVFSDNPTLTREYIESLDKDLAMKPHTRARLFEGRWVTAEGMIYEAFDPSVHVLKGDLEAPDPDEGRRFWTLNVKGWENPVELTWFMASVDWGSTSPGVIQVWGIDKDRRAFMVAEVYRINVNPNWWAERAERLRKKFDIQRFICDSADPGRIQIFNDRMGRAGGHWIAHPAEKSWDAGVAIVRERLEDREMFFLEDALDSVDKSLESLGKAVRTVDEISAYIIDPKAAERGLEKPVSSCADHGCDTFRYGMYFLERADWQPAGIEEDPYPEGCWGNILSHDEVESWEYEGDEVWQTAMEK